MTEVQDETPQPEAPPEHQQQSGTSYAMEGDGWVVGNLTREPETRFTNNGLMVVQLRIAYTPRVKNPVGDGWIDQPTVYHDVTVWRQQGENVIESLTAGDRVIAAGQWQRQTWMAKDGEVKSRLVLIASEVGASLLFRQVRIVKVQRQGGR